MRLIQFQHEEYGRRAGVVDGNTCQLLERFPSLYAMAQSAIAESLSIDAGIERHMSDEPAQRLVSGTGLTHMTSAKNRDTMHEKDNGDVPSTDSMQVFQ